MSYEEQTAKVIHDFYMELNKKGGGKNGKSKHKS
jgi:hypothetical protein